MFGLGALHLGLTALSCLPAATFVTEVLIGSPAPRRRHTPQSSFEPRTVVLVPAHNEEGGIEATLANLKSELGSKMSILVVADNCQDDTPARAERSGVKVVRRVDRDRRGKGYALEFGLNELAHDPPDVVIIVDADCRVEPGSLKVLAQRAYDSDRPIQGEYLILPPRLEPRTAINALAFMIKNRVRPLGLARLGLPCQLTGSGMAFPWQVIRSAPAMHDHLVEDLMMGLELARQGKAPLFCPEARIKSELPERERAQEGQRRRWEHGHIATLLEQGPKLVLEGLREGKLDLLALGLDLMVPPLTLSVLGLAAVVGVNTVLALGLGASTIPLLMSAGALVAVGLAVLTAWIAQGRDLVPLTYALQVPRYMAWKLPLYRAFAGQRQATWEQTERS
jgi:cellulose synthase/poly-beta-1,6-N-acetylglucosamine synthase-like glycosyltransferase